MWKQLRDYYGYFLPWSEFIRYIQRSLDHSNWISHMIYCTSSRTLPLKGTGRRRRSEYGGHTTIFRISKCINSVGKLSTYFLYSTESRCWNGPMFSRQTSFILYEVKIFFRKYNYYWRCRLCFYFIRTSLSKSFFLISFLCILNMYVYWAIKL